MKTQITNASKIASINRLSHIVSLAALVLLLCFAHGAWAQPMQVMVTNGPTAPIFTQGLHAPAEFHFGPGQTATIPTVPSTTRFVIEHINIQAWGPTAWFVELVGSSSNGVYNNTAFMLQPVPFGNGARSFAVVTSTGKMFASGGTTFQFNFSNSTTFNTLAVPPNVWVEVWGYYESTAVNVGDDF